MSLNVLIIGAGGHAQVVADILWRMNEADGSVRPVGYLDDEEALWGKRFLDIPVVGATADIDDFSHDAVIIAIGNNRIRYRLAQTLSQSGERFAIACHPAAILAPDVVIDPGVMICAGVVVNTGSKVGAHVILNTGCTIDHHNEISPWSHIAPGVHLGGEVTVEEGGLVGIGATVLPRTRIGAWSVVAAGAVVTRDVPAETIVVGVPAHPLKKGLQD